MNEVVILEGPDGAGKTTLYETQFKNLGFNLIHNGVFPSPPEAYSAYRDQQETIRKLDKVVLDRSHISQAIYGPIYRGERHQKLQHKIVDGVFFQMEAVVVLCYTHLVYTNWASRPHKEYVKDETNFRKIMRAYDYKGITEYTDLPVVLYDYSNEEENELIPLPDRVQIIRENFYG